MYCYIGLDVGTTNIKAGAFSDDGVQLGFHSERTPSVRYPENDELYDFDVEKLFEVVCLCVKNVMDSLPEYKARSVSISSFAESGVPLTAEYEPLCRSIAWFDTRTAPEAEFISNSLGAENIYRMTGQVPSFMFGITKFLWFKNHNPELYKKTRYWLSINDYLLFRLSGEMCVDYSIASRTMAFDIRKLTWCSEVLDVCGFTPDMFSIPVPGGTKIGTVKPDVCAATGLSAETAVVAGGHDHSCASVGAGVLEKNSFLSSMGTAEATVFVLDDPITTHEMFLSQCAIYPHCSKHLYRALLGIQACGASMEWFLSCFSSEFQKDGVKSIVAAEEIAAASPNDENLMFFPLIRGSIGNPDASGMFTGIRDYQNIGHFSKAMFDGICCESAYQTKKCMAAMGTDLRKQIVVGGPSKSAYMMQRKVNYSRMELTVSSHKEAASFGAASLAMVGVGDISFEELPARNLSDSRTYTADSDPYFCRHFEKYSRIRPYIDKLGNIK